MFRFGFDHFLSALLLVPLLGGLLWHAGRRRREALRRFGDLDLVRRLSESVRPRARLVKGLLAVAAVFALVLALARPQFGTRVETVRREGQDIVVALDVSASMLAEDMAPNRLEKAKHAVGTLFGRLTGDRVGLVAFAGDAFVQSPLTVDYGAASMFLHAMDPDLIPVEGTDLGRALEVALDAFVETERQYRVLVLITDGEDHQGGIDEAVERAVENGVRIYTVGIGSPDGVPVPVFDDRGRPQGFLRDDQGAVVTTRLDEDTLREIARATGGRYQRLSVSETEVDALADEIAAMEGREVESQQVTQFDEQYQIFLGLGLLLWCVELLIPERRRATGDWRGRVP